MIPQRFIEQWQGRAPWQNLAMVEQDLIISRALVDLYQHEKVKQSLVFRGGTALNKLYIQPPARYSEDLDFVQSQSEPIGETINAIRFQLDPWLGEPRRKLTERSAKLVYRYTAVDGVSAKLKIEINTTEHFQVNPLQFHEFSIGSKWFEGSSQVVSYDINELMGTKLRALYQRRKGRDLFDLWYCLTQDLIVPKEVVAIFSRYGKHNQELITRAMFEKNMHAKKQHQGFQSDIEPLLPAGIPWNFTDALQIVDEALIRLVPGEPWLDRNKED